MRRWRAAAPWWAGVGLLLLVALLITLFVARQPESTIAPGTPQGTVSAFLRSLEQGDTDQAYALTTKDLDRQSFQQQFAAWRSTTHRVTLIGTSTYGQSAEVQVTIRYAGGGAVGLQERTQDVTFYLIQENANWRIGYWGDLWL